LRGRLGEVTRLFLRLGLTAFGGPAAHVALMHEEVVRRRRWLEEQQFLDLVGATNLIPGPNSTELAMHIGRLRARWMGLVAAGLSFMVPAVLIVLLLAWAYVEYGTTAPAEGLLYGLQPAVIAVVLYAIVALGRTALRTWPLAFVAAAVAALYLVGVSELVLLFGAAAAVMLFQNADRWIARPHGLVSIPLGIQIVLSDGGGVAPDLGRLFLVLLKVGALLYGSGYVLLAFLRSDLVVDLEWLTEAQLLDAVSVGQVTPGPLFSTAAFVGYVVGGLPGAMIATVAIFLPSFVFVAATGPLIPRLRRSPWTAGLLDGVNAAAVGLIVAVLWLLGRTAIVDVPTALIATASAVVLFSSRLNPAVVLAAGGLVGAGVRLVGA
jgi:chromate transporter